MANAETRVWSRRYRTALVRFLRQQPSQRPATAPALGHEAVALGLDALTIAGIHEQILATDNQPGGIPGGSRKKTRERAKTFFRATIAPIESTHQAARKADMQIAHLHRSLRQCTGELDETSSRLQQATKRRKATSRQVRESKQKHAQLQAEARRIQARLRARLHAILTQQEEERAQTGHTLRDELAQALVGIDLGLLALAQEDEAHVATLEKSIAQAQQFLQESSSTISATSDQQDTL